VEFLEMLLECGAMVGPEFKNGDAPGGRVLLQAEVLVRHDQHCESRRFRASLADRRAWLDRRNPKKVWEA
jgi:hypothetical protein